MKRWRQFGMVLIAALVLTPVLCAAAGSDAEQRVLDYVREHLKPGQPLIVSDLYSKVFTQPDERQALNKLYNAFFRIPLFVAQYQNRFGAPPSLKTIAQQFDLKSPGAADVLLRVMETDPRVPKFITRDAATGEITSVDVEAIKADARFGQVIERQLSGWEGRPAPAISLPGLNGPDVELAAVSGKTILLYVWFTGCPPCMKETPELVALDGEMRARGLLIVGANADRFLNLDYDDAVRKQYLDEHQVHFPVGYWTRPSDAAFGHIAIFPTLFLISPKGVIMHHWVGYTAPEELRQAVTPVLATGADDPSK